MISNCCTSRKSSKIIKNQTKVLLYYFFLLALLITFAFRNLIFTSQFFKGNENIFAVYPWKYFFSKAVCHFQLPLWTNNIFCGFPIHAEPCMAIFYPPDWLFYLIFSPQNAYKLSVVLDFLLIAFFSFLFLRELELDFNSSLFGTLAFTFCGFNLGLIIGITVLRPIPWIPATMLCLKKYLKKSKPRYLLYLAITIAISFLSGFPQISLYNLLLVLAYFLWHIFQQSNKRLGEKLKMGGYFFLLIFSAVAIAAPSLLPTYQSISYSERAGGVSYEFASIGSLNPLQLITLVLPNILLGNYGVLGFYACLYIGLLPLFAVIALLIRKQLNKEITFWAGALFLTLMFAIGKYNPLYHFLHKLPGFAFFRQPYRVLIIFEFALITLASFGFPYLISPDTKAKNSRKYIGLASLGLGLFLILANWVGKFLLSSLYSYFQIKEEFVLLPALFLIITGLCLLIIKRTNLLTFSIISLTIIDILAFGTQGRVFDFLKPTEYQGNPKIVKILKNDRSLFRIYTSPPPPEKKYQKERYLPWKANSERKAKALMTCLNMLYELDSWTGNVSLDPKKNLDLTSIIEGDQIGHEYEQATKKRIENKADFLGKLNVKYIITEENLSSKDYFLITKDGSLRLYQNLKWKPRAYLANSFLLFPNQKEVFEKIKEEGFPDNTVLLTKKIPRTLTMKKGWVKIKTASNDLVKINAWTDGWGALVLMDTYYPGWKATIDGKPTKIYLANYLFRAVLIPPGHHKVKFIYDPPSLKIGAIISLFSIFAIFLLIFFPNKLESADSNACLKIEKIK